MSFLWRVSGTGSFFAPFWNDVGSFSEHFGMIFEAFLICLLDLVLLVSVLGRGVIRAYALNRPL